MILNKGLLNASQINNNYTFDKLLNVSQINGLGIYNIIGITIGNEVDNTGIDIIKLILNFENRVYLNSGYFTNESCLITTLTELNNIN